MSGTAAEAAWCVLRLTEERVDVSAVAQVAADALGRPKFELTRALRTSHGIVARDAPEAAARGIAEGLKAMGIEARLIREADLRALPPAEKANQMLVGPKGLYVRVADENVVVMWEDLLLVVAARLGGAVQHVFQPARDYVVGPYGTRANIASTFDWSTTRRVTRLVVDFYPRQPWRRIRVEEGSVDFRLDRDASRPSAASHFEELGRQIRAMGGSVVLNAGARILGEHGKELTWQDVTFENDQLLDSYSLWQVQVALLQRSG